MVRNWNRNFEKISKQLTCSSLLETVLDAVIDDDVLWTELRKLCSLVLGISGARIPLKNAYALIRDTWFEPVSKYMRKLYYLS